MKLSISKMKNSKEQTIPGVTIDNKLTFKSYITNLCKKASQKITWDKQITREGSESDNWWSWKWFWNIIAKIIITFVTITERFRHSWFKSLKLKKVLLHRSWDLLLKGEKKYLQRKLNIFVNLRQEEKTLYILV